MLTDNSTAPLILLVEDDSNHAELIKRSLDEVHEEYRLEVVGTVCDAKTAAERLVPNLVLTDYRLPDGDGSELVLAAAGLWPVIIMTSQGSEKVAVEAMKIGAQDYIVKSPEAFGNLSYTIKYGLMAWALVLARRKADEGILQAKKDWEQTFDAVPDLISIIDTNHTIVRANKAMADRFGLTPVELAGRNCYEVVHALDTPSDRCPCTSVQQDGLTHSEVFEEKWLNVYFKITASPIFDQDGRIKACVHVMRDVTEQKRSEELLRQRMRLRDIALTSSVDELMRVTLDICELLTDSSIGFFHLVNEDQQSLTLQAWSTNTLASVCTAEGHGNHYPVSKAGVWAECFHTREPVIHNDYSALPNRKGMPVGHAQVQRELTVPVIINDNVVSIIGVGNKAFPYTEQDVQIVKMFVTFASEVIGRKKAEDERQMLEQQFQQTQKLESLGVLAGGIAHDFNNILTIILGHCFMVKEDFDSEMSDKAHVEQIESAANRAADLCRQMLAYAGKSPLVQTQVSLWDLVDDTVNMLQSAIKKNVTFEVELDHAIPEIKGDSGQIQQIVMNLIINAAEAIGDRNGKIGIKLNSEVVRPEQAEVDYFSRYILPGSYACLTVSDDGCGMDYQTQSRIFEPFYTTKFAGRGLGMSAILGIIKSHGGALKLSSLPGAGTTFKIYLPITGRTEMFDVPAAAENVHTTSGSGTILLVDDELALLAIGTALLDSMGFSSITAPNGLQALEIFNRRGSEIDIVLLDLIMPKMGGLETFKELRKISGSVPIVICSGYSIDDLPEDISSDPYMTAIQKPYRLDQLKETLTRFMEYKRK